MMKLSSTNILMNIIRKADKMIDGIELASSGLDAYATCTGNHSKKSCKC